MAKNNFDELHELGLKNADKLSDDVKQNILNTRSMFNFFGNVISLFLPKLIDMITMLFSTDDRSKKKKS